MVENILFAKAPSGEVYEAITDEAKAITLREAEEGIVLLTNQNGTLPLADHSAYLLGAMNGSKHRFDGLKG